MQPESLIFDSQAVDSLIARVSTSSSLLIASDFDGTLSEFTYDPNESNLDRFAVLALRKLAELPNTCVAIISGRALSDLASRFNGLDKIRLIGSHGHEFDLDSVASLSDEQRDLLARALEIMKRAAEKLPGTRVEIKPHGVVFHFRGLRIEPLEALYNLTRELVSVAPDRVRRGNKVIEFCITATNKGDAILRLKNEISPTLTVFLGDDVTDEAAFEALSPDDIAIKIGPGPTSARLRVQSVENSVKLLSRIAERRHNWINEVTATPINHHLFISDLRTAALIDERATLTWFCTPRFDGTPLFGSLVGGPACGRFSISASGTPSQRYIQDTLIGQTVFDSVSVTDLLDCSLGRPFQRPGRSDLVRIIEGSGDVEISFEPKLDFGRIPTQLYKCEQGLRVECGQQRFVLHSPQIDWEISKCAAHDLARTKKRLTDARVQLTLMSGTAGIPTASRSPSVLIQSNMSYWKSWLASLNFPNRHYEAVSRSALVLRGLSFGPNGAMVAAATTGLPAIIGGPRNWDYRFCWLRDACLSASALLRLSAISPAMRLMDWLLGIMAESNSDEFLAPLYSIIGSKVPSEAIVLEAIGYRGSRPIRVGNLAAEQLQLDSVGPIAELLWNLAKNQAPLTDEHLLFCEKLVAMIERSWADKDSGIWESRSVQRHYVHSKLMCWYALKCCGAVLNYLGESRPAWSALAVSIRQQIEDFGFNSKLGSYVAAYDLAQPDAALLWIILSGFHPPDHPRSLGTVRYINEHLFRDEELLRYTYDDALPGEEGEFVICRCWFIEALAMIGEKSRAEELLNTLISRSAPLYLQAEQFSTKNKLMLGNYPQAYSHLGIINAACAISGSDKRSGAN